MDCGGSVCGRKPCDEDWVQWAWVEGDMSLWAVSFVLFAGLVLYCNRCREGTLVWSKETVGGGGAILVVTAFIVWSFAFQSLRVAPRPLLRRLRL